VGIFEPQLERFVPLAGIGQLRFALEPRALLLRVEELTQALG
jgi:hypothetical protein